MKSAPQRGADLFYKLPQRVLLFPDFPGIIHVIS